MLICLERFSPSVDNPAIFDAIEASARDVALPSYAHAIKSATDNVRIPIA
jgi:hypothetical protein